MSIVAHGPPVSVMSWWCWAVTGTFVLLFLHQSFVTTAPHLQGWAGLMCRAVTFLVPPQCRINAGLVTLRKYTPIQFTIIKSRNNTHSRSPQCRAFSRAVMDEKSSSLFPVVRGAPDSGYKWLTRFMTAGSWPRVSTYHPLCGAWLSTVESNKCHFYFVFICSYCTEDFL